MAESGSPSNSDVPPPSSSSSVAAAPPDWEVLTMSMSASSLGKAHGGDPDVFEKSNPQVESSFKISLNEGDFASDVWAVPLHASVSGDSSNDIEADPFTEGWKAHHSASSGLYGYAGEQNMPVFSEGAETYFDSNASMSIADGLLPEGLHVSEKDDKDEEEIVLPHDHSVDDVKKHDEIVKKEKIKRKGRPKKSSTVVWSIAVVASVAGIFFLGNRLRLAYHQNHQLEIQLSAKDEKVNEMLLQVNRLKEVLGKHHGVSISRN